MSSLDRNISQTQLRLGLNRWLEALGWCLIAAAAAWAVMVLADKIFGLEWPRALIAAGLTALCLVVSPVWAYLRREDRLAAAAVLDAAAGLKERTSSGLYCLGSDDPFAYATVLDAEHASRRTTVRSYIRYAWPSSLSFATVALLGAVIVTFLPIRPLEARERLAQRDDDAALMRTEVKRVKTRLQQFKQRAKSNPALAELQKPLKTVDDLPPEKLNTPVSVRREAIKNIDRLADALRKKRDENHDRRQALKNMFRGLKATKNPTTPTEQLSRALSKGDFRAARNALKDMREQLAKLAAKQDPEQLRLMQEQVARLSKQLEQAAKQQEQKERLQQELQKAGVDAELAKRALENLTKADQQQVKEQMKKQGANQQQIKEMMKKLQGQQQAGQQGSNLAEALQKTAQAMSGAQGLSDAARQLEMMGDQLNAMEQLEQQLGELDSMLADARDMQNEMFDEQGSFCQNCGGKGCGRCQGGMGQNPRQGRGGRAPEQETDIRFKKQRTKVITTKGSIISKMLIEGEQVRGDVSTQAVELITAAEREATDALNDQRIPNQYRGAVKKYFSQLRRDFEAPADPEGAGQSGGQEQGQPPPTP